jgi:putative NIF3 family GTP cyclohydrolase 1 type 2
MKHEARSGSFLLQALALTAALAVAAAPSVSQTSLTARGVVERIQKSVGVEWKTDTVDTFKAGNPDAAVTGVVTTLFPTFRVLQAAAASGKNLIICHEPAFYDHYDQAADLLKDGDRVLADKKAFIEKNGLIVWRFHDHWHIRRPDGILQGMVRALGWEKLQDPADPEMFSLPRVRLGDLCRELQSKLGTEEVRVVGNMDMILSRVSFLAGAPDSIEQMRSLGRADVDAAIIGETREWETLEYARDAVDEGKAKALIILGHVPSEEAGMEECARWLMTFVTEVPVEFIPSGLPYRVVK